jgi:glycosyltransferase involved in cell wall biosynthesis
VVDGVNGLVVPPGDAGALAAALDRITGDPTFASELRRNCVKQHMRVQSYADVARRLVGGLEGVTS